MILRRVIREQILEYFRGENWRELMDVLLQGRERILHAHIYTDSILHPDSARRVFIDYFAAHDRLAERKVKLLSHGKGYTNVYYLQPEGMCHFEVFLRYNPDVVLEPMPADLSRGGKAFEFWDKPFMERYYRKYRFRPFDNEAKSAVESYFQSDAWRRIYATMVYENERNVHAHCIVETSLHPEEILPIGRSEIEKRGWVLDRAVSIVFNVNGLDQGKITYLVKEPEVVLELEWEFNPDVLIVPAVVPLARVTSTDMVDADMAGIPYLQLESDDFIWLKARFNN